jgi:hypothetical protein
MKISDFPIGINQEIEYYLKIFVPRLVPLPQSIPFDATRCVLSEYIKTIPVSQIKVAIRLEKPSK